MLCKVLVSDVVWRLNDVTEENFLQRADEWNVFGFQLSWLISLRESRLLAQSSYRQHFTVELKCLPCHLTNELALESLRACLLIHEHQTISEMKHVYPNVLAALLF